MREPARFTRADLKIMELEKEFARLLAFVAQQVKEIADLKYAVASLEESSTTPRTDES